jgi:hypothetical protein
LVQDDATNPLRKRPEEYGPNYQDHLLKQYSIVVDDALKVSARRSVANTFFLTVSTGLLSTEGVMISQTITRLTVFQAAFVTILTVASILFCSTWYFVILSYQQLNAGKFQIIHEIERALPSETYRTEWSLLGKGKNHSKYRPTSELERRVPLIYIAIFVVVEAAILILYAFG